MKITNVTEGRIIDFKALKNGKFYVLADEKEMLFQKINNETTLVLNNISPIYDFGEYGTVSNPCKVIPVKIKEIKYKEV